MNEYPWCIDAKNIPLGFLEDSAEAYYAEFETVHSQIDEDEWKQIVEPMNLTENGLEEYETKPDLLTWFQLSEPDCWGENRTYLQNYDVVPEMEQIVEILLRILQGDMQLPDDQKEFKTEPQTTTVRQLQRGDWVNFPIDDIVIGLNVVFENTSASAREAFNECLNLTNNIRTKLDNITCPPAVPYFKDEYQKALLKLAQPEIDKLSRDAAAARAQAEAASMQPAGWGARISSRTQCGWS